MKQISGPVAADKTEKWSARAPVTFGLLGLLVLVGGFGSWATFTEISGAIIASGQIEVDRNRQVVQHPDGGVVTEILVIEGDSVAAGQVLVRLDPTLLQSDLNTVESQLYELMARRARLSAERDEVSEITYDSELVTVAAMRPEVLDLMEGQSRLFEARNSTVTQQTEQLRLRRQQIASQITGVVAQQAALETQLDLIQQELTNQQALLAKGLAQATRVLSLQREEARLRGTVGELTAGAAEAEERMTEIDIQILQLGTTRQEEAITQMRDIQYRELELAERRRSLKERLNRLDITAPVAGIVYGMQVFAERSVVRPADPVLFIVPQDRPLVIASRVAAINVDQIYVGQAVVLRFSAFDSRTTPEFDGTVKLISADAFVDEASQGSFYRAEILLNDRELDKLPANLTLIPGMPVEAFLKTEDRSPIAYLIKPLADYFNKAFRES
ncbi:HlyD family type I secretion periplasmic adaptor subunit [Oceaniovalibus sp. ACAM 378]|uniref:HlyD family type I secretion periplasmic adaptor subunit n=1 Tax=Oceaniovalibus sp. ACAM 378 TaxID=2599923 RepID=UPI0011D70B39|nr:HlyD family type I secretion periplasmic adaptor subunit [Oceaniovalibus sp. ACAM 378]TYB88416.1 HlyD family type I secretion periplasmic adaptor subunit [Oceaniovalibus sp. ACAM 378]